MNTHHKIHRLARLILSSVLLLAAAACAAGGEPAPEEEGLVTSSGFACPEPNPRIESESETINIFT